MGAAGPTPNRVTPDRQRYRELVDRFGLRVRCMNGHQLRHRPERQGRLRDRRCPECGDRLHDEQWWKRKASREGWELSPFEA